MGLFALPLRLAARAKLVAADVAALFAPIVNAINGNIDASNYAPAARVPNGLKAQPYAVFAVQARWARPASLGAEGFPEITIPLRSSETVITGWDVYVNGGNATGNAKLYADGVQIGTTQALAAATGMAATETFAPVTGKTRLQASFTGTITGGSMHVLVWCKERHVR